MVVKLVCLSLFVGVSMAGVYRGTPPTIPDELSHKKGCYVKEMHDVIPFNSSIVPNGHCSKIYCIDPVLYYKTTCLEFEIANPKCHVPDPDLSKPFPKCCPRIQCESY